MNEFFDFSEYLWIFSEFFYNSKILCFEMFFFVQSSENFLKVTCNPATKNIQNSEVFHKLGKNAQKKFIWIYKN